MQSIPRLTVLLILLLCGCSSTGASSIGKSTIEKDWDAGFPPLARKSAHAPSPTDGTIHDDPVVIARTAGRRSSPPHEAAAPVALRDVFFQFDSALLTATAQEMLQDDAGRLKRYEDMGLMIEGYCDERGTDAYNLVLGERRAQAVKRYLSDLGVRESNMLTVSFGKTRPFCQEPSETCYEQNRRARIGYAVR